MHQDQSAQQTEMLFIALSQPGRLSAIPGPTALISAGASGEIADKTIIISIYIYNIFMLNIMNYLIM